MGVNLIHEASFNEDFKECFDAFLSYVGDYACLQPSSNPMNVHMDLRITVGLFETCPNERLILVFVNVKYCFVVVTLEKKSSF